MLNLKKCLIVVALILSIGNSCVCMKNSTKKMSRFSKGYKDYDEPIQNDKNLRTEKEKDLEDLLYELLRLKEEIEDKSREYRRLSCIANSDDEFMRNDMFYGQIHAMLDDKNNYDELKDKHKRLYRRLQKERANFSDDEFEKCSENAQKKFRQYREDFFSEFVKNLL